MVSSWVEQMAACLADKKVDCWVAKWAGLKAEMGKSVVVESALKKVGSLVSMLVTLLMVDLLAVQSVGK